MFRLINNVIEKHKQLIKWYQDKLRLSDYQLLWVVFFKGIIISIIFHKLL